MYKDILKQIDQVKIEKLSTLGLTKINKDDPSNLKYIDTERIDYDGIEKFWKNIYNGNDQDKVLDFGCGGGRYTFVGRKLGHDVIGLDINQKILFDDDVLERLHKIYKIQKYITFYDGDVIPFDESIFDSILFSVSIIKDFIVSKKERVITNYKYMNRLECKIKDLIKISKNDSTWYITPHRHITKIKPFFDEFNNKNIKIKKL